MNKLSWAIYGMDVIQSFGICLVIAGGVAIVAILVRTAAIAIHNDDNYDKKSYPLLREWLRIIPIFVVAIFIPSSTTIKLIVASEFGERMYNYERVQGIVDPGLKFVEKWLNDQIASNSKGK